MSAPWWDDLNEYPSPLDVKELRRDASELLEACATARGAVFALVEMLTAEMTGEPNRDLRHLNCKALAEVAKELTAAIAKAEGR